MRQPDLVQWNEELRTAIRLHAQVKFFAEFGRVVAAIQGGVICACWSRYGRDVHHRTFLLQVEHYVIRDSELGLAMLIYE